MKNNFQKPSRRLFELKSRLPAKEDSNYSWVAKLASDALLLAVLSSVGYCLAYSFEAGYARHFGYPTYVVSPTPSVIVPALFIVIGVVLTIAPMVVDVLDSSLKYGQKKLHITTIFVFFILIFLTFGFTTNNFKVPDFWVLVYLVSYVILLFVMLYVGLNYSFPRKNVKIVMFMAFATISMLALSALLGTLYAYKTKVFYFLNDGSDYALVKIYGDLGVAVKYDFINEKFLTEYRFLKIGDNEKEIGLKRTYIDGERLPVHKRDNK